MSKRKQSKTVRGSQDQGHSCELEVDGTKNGRRREEKIARGRWTAARKATVAARMNRGESYGYKE